MVRGRGAGAVSTEFETLEPDWLGVAEARDRILGAAAPLPSVDVPLEDAIGCVLASDLRARLTLPPWDNSAMDGYAVRGDDVEGAAPDAPSLLRVTGVLRAGEEPSTPVEPGTAVRIMTGAPLPPGADTVIRVEHTDRERAEAGVVRVRSDEDRGRHVRPAGEDVEEGTLLLDEGTEVGPAQVGALAAQGYDRIPVRRRPTVAILPTGDELVPLQEFDRIGGSGIPESNGPALAAAVRGAGCAARPLPVAPDRKDAILQGIKGARGTDVLVTTGGASMGEADLLKRVLDDEGFRLDFWRVRIRPGSPFSLGFLPGADEEPALPVFGLPGNPASAFVTFQVLVRPYLLALAGHRRVHRAVVTAEAGEALRSPARLTHFFRVTLDETGTVPVARMSGPQGSGLVVPTARARGLAVVDEGVEEIGAGDPVRVVLLDEGPGAREDAGY